MDIRILRYFLTVAKEQNFTKAAEQGGADAQSNLGVCYYCGNGVKQNYTKAV